MHIKLLVNNGCLQPQFLMPQKQKHFLYDSAVSKELFTVFKKVVQLLNTCTTHVITVKKPETYFRNEFATQWTYQKNLLLAHVKLTLNCCHCTVRAGSRMQYLISIILGCFNRNFLVSFPEIAVFFRSSSASSSCLIYVQLFSQRGVPTRPRLYFIS